MALFDKTSTKGGVARKQTPIFTQCFEVCYAIRGSFFYFYLFRMLHFFIEHKDDVSDRDLKKRLVSRTKTIKKLWNVKKNTRDVRSMMTKNVYLFDLLSELLCSEISFEYGIINIIGGGEVAKAKKITVNME